MDYYKILNVGKDASEGQIKSAYRNLSKKYHPDVNPGDAQAERRFQEVSEAYAILGEPAKRQAYDKERAAAKAPGGKEAAKKERSRTQNQASFHYEEMSAQFEQFFGFGAKNDTNGKQSQTNKQENKTNPIDMTDMFERYMGFGGKKK